MIGLIGPNTALRFVRARTREADCQGRRHARPDRRGGGRSRARPRRRWDQPRRHPRRDGDQQEPAVPLLPRRQERAGRRDRGVSEPSGCSTPSARSWTRSTRWEAWDGWRDAVLAHYCSQPHWGCPIGSLVGELAGRDPALAAQVAAHMDEWRELPRRGPRADAGRRPAAPRQPIHERWRCRRSPPSRAACC